MCAVYVCFHTGMYPTACAWVVLQILKPLLFLTAVIMMITTVLAMTVSTVCVGMYAAGILIVPLAMAIRIDSTQQ